MASSPDFTEFALSWIDSKSFAPADFVSRKRLARKNEEHAGGEDSTSWASTRAKEVRTRACTRASESARARRVGAARQQPVAQRDATPAASFAAILLCRECLGAAATAGLAPSPGVWPPSSSRPRSRFRVSSTQSRHHPRIIPGPRRHPQSSLGEFDIEAEIGRGHVRYPRFFRPSEYKEEHQIKNLEDSDHYSYSHNQLTTAPISGRQFGRLFVSYDNGLRAGKTTGQVVLPIIRGKRRRLARKRLCNWPGHIAHSDPPEPKQKSQLARLRL
ncbi:hypothetical protein B0H14DRAFT_2606594 [Mycena olivaceomarginata]|nr:hypothetical protein B0H14DRAFT_2606594 [Mycena olivaceomarginata]